MTPRSAMAMSRSGPERSKPSVTSPSSPFACTVASSTPSRQARSSRSPKRTRSPTRSRLPGFMNAVQRCGASRLCNVASMRTTDPSRSRRPESRAGITRVSLNTTASPGRSSPGRSLTTPSASAPPAPTTSKRAESRGLAGRSAIRSSGRSKSKSERRIGRPAYASRPPRANDATLSGGIRGHAGGDDLARLARRLALGQGVDVLHALGDDAPDRVVAVQVRRFVEADEELAVGRVWVVGPGHRADAAHVRLGRELRAQIRLRRAARARARWVAALGHESWNHPVEHDPVVEPFARQLLDPLHVSGGEIGPQPDRDRAGLEREDQDVLRVVGHRGAPSVWARTRLLARVRRALQAPRQRSDFQTRAPAPILRVPVQQLKGGGPVSHCLQPRSHSVTWSLEK